MNKSVISYVSDIEFDNLIENNLDVQCFESKRWRKLKVNDSYEIRSRKTENNIEP